MPQSLLGSLIRRWWMPPVMLTVGVLAALGWTSRQPSVYRASAVLVVVPTEDLVGGADILRSLDALERRTLLATFARLPSTHESKRAVADLLEREAHALSDFRIGASVVPNTNLVRIDVDGPDPQLASRVANAAGGVTADHVRSLYRIYTMRPIAAAQPSQRPVSPDPRRNVLVSGILGLFVGVVAAAGVGYGRT